MSSREFLTVGFTRCHVNLPRHLFTLPFRVLANKVHLGVKGPVYGPGGRLKTSGNFGGLWCWCPWSSRFFMAWYSHTQMDLCHLFQVQNRRTSCEWLVMDPYVCWRILHLWLRYDHHCIRPDMFFPFQCSFENSDNLLANPNLCRLDSQVLYRNIPSSHGKTKVLCSEFFTAQHQKEIHTFPAFLDFLWFKSTSETIHPA